MGGNAGIKGRKKETTSVKRERKTKKMDGNGVAEVKNNSLSMKPKKVGGGKGGQQNCGVVTRGIRKGQSS